jgi:adenosylcobinamide-GDP ribazoletransferase
VKFAPLVGGLIGLAGGLIYWLALQVWPASVAVILAMAATTLLSFSFGPARDLAALPLNRADVSLQVLYLLVKYSALMALTAAKLPFAAPAEATLGLVMICGYAASGALMVSVWTITPGEPAKLNNTDLGIALLIGFAPAALLGIPGLTGLAAAIVVSFAFTIYVKITGAVRTAQRLELTQQLTETAFYLGALATWSYV